MPKIMPFWISRNIWSIRLSLLESREIQESNCLFASQHQNGRKIIFWKNYILVWQEPFAGWWSIKGIRSLFKYDEIREIHEVLT